LKVEKIAVEKHNCNSSKFQFLHLEFNFCSFCVKNATKSINTLSGNDLNSIKQKDYN